MDEFEPHELLATLAPSDVIEIETNLFDSTISFRLEREERDFRWCPVVFGGVHAFAYVSHANELPTSLGSDFQRYSHLRSFRFARDGCGIFHESTSDYSEQKSVASANFLLEFNTVQLLVEASTLTIRGKTFQTDYPALSD